MTRITFNHVAPEDTYRDVPDGYRMMEWSNWGAVDEDYAPLSGLHNVNQGPGDDVGFTYDGLTATMHTHGADFDLAGGYFAAVWSAGLTVTFTGYDDGVQVARQRVVLDQSSVHILFKHGFDSIDTLTIKTSGGTDQNPNDGGEGDSVCMDNLKVLFEGAPAGPDGSLDGGATDDALALMPELAALIDHHSLGSEFVL